MAKYLAPVAKMQFFDLNGDVLSGGKVYTYITGSSTPATTWTDSTGNAANTNPIVLDSRGEADIWVTEGTIYRFILKTSADVQIWSVDGIQSKNSFENLTVTGTLASSGTLTGAPQWLCFDVTSETGTLTTGTAKRTFRLPACTITAARASLTTASSSGIPTFDVNDDGTSIFGASKLTIDANETTSTTAASTPSIDNPAVADDSQITIDCDVAGTSAVGAKVYLKVKWTA